MPNLRYAMPRAERRHTWLSPLLDAYAMVDASVVASITAAARLGKTIPCSAGCAHCCRQPVPLTPLEAAGLRLLVAESNDATLKARILDGVARNRAGLPDCPFLHAAACLAYPLRPIACRRFMVAGAPCLADEDPTLTRPQDMLRPERRVMLEALRLTLPYYQANGLIQKTEATFEDFAALSVLVQHIDWTAALQGS